MEGHGTVTPLPFEGWDVGSIGVTYDEPEERIVVVLEELTGEDETPASALLVRFTLAQARRRSPASRFELVAQGRPNCRFCGQPIDPDGHACPRMN